MWRVLGAVVLCAGCAASSAQLEGEAQQHYRQAAAAASIRDYDRAAEEQAKADELHKDAVKRAVKEGRANDLAFIQP